MSQAIRWPVIWVAFLFCRCLYNTICTFKLSNYRPPGCDWACRIYTGKNRVVKKDVLKTKFQHTTFCVNDYNLAIPKIDNDNEGHN